MPLSSLQLANDLLKDEEFKVLPRLPSMQEQLNNQSVHFGCDCCDVFLQICVFTPELERARQVWTPGSRSV